jgi:hypothetical protein
MYSDNQTNNLIKGVRFTNEKNVTKEQILEEANTIWHQAMAIWRSRGISDEDHKELDAVYDQFAPDHKELYSSYPTVMKHMLKEQYYHPRAFERYLSRVASKPWTNDAERLESYSDYFVILYKTVNPKYDPAFVRKLRSDYATRVKKEHDEMIALFEASKNDVYVKETAVNDEKRLAALSRYVAILREYDLTEDQISQCIDEINNRKVPVWKIERLIAEVQDLLFKRKNIDSFTPQ